MSRVSTFLSSLAVLLIAVSLSGCGGTGDSPPAADQPEATSGEEQHAGHMMSASTEVKEALAELSPEDRAAAEKQRICPVTDEALGSMGKPVTVAYQGRDVLLCCRGCEARFMNDPDKYLAKLNP